jgi:hypothetical protein
MIRGSRYAAATTATMKDGLPSVTVIAVLVCLISPWAGSRATNHWDAEKVQAKIFYHIGSDATAALEKQIRYRWWR